MRTTIDIPEREHELFVSLAHSQRTSLSKLVVELALRGLKAPARVAEETAKYEIDPLTGLGVFRSGHPITTEQVKAFLEDDDLPA
ncbi:MAG: hypothetical protein JSR27_09825 [Proteobacteria bacterium]|nr:hypothetical protein [Pseudomonadota bacterium]